VKLKKYFLITLSLLVLSFTVSAQNARTNFDRVRTYDVQHYIIRVGFDRAKRRIFGDTTVQLKPLKSRFTIVELDAANLDIQSVTLEPTDTPLKFKTSGEKVIVTLNKPYAANNLISIRFKYTATPKKGIYFVDELSYDGEEVHPEQIWTQGEADEAHHWFPSFDFPSDKATTEEFITADKDETVIGNGELIDRKENADGTATSHFKMPVPHSVYLVSFVIGKYTRIADTYKQVPLGYYVFPGKESIVPDAFGKTKDAMRVFEQLTGVDYPYNKYDQTIVSQFQFGGMENITATTLADTDVFFAPVVADKPGVDDLVSHELSHSWFGDLVTCKNWAELWLNEGFATFMEAAFREKMYGRENYIEKIKINADEFIVDDAINPKRNALYNLNAGNIAALFDRPATIYSKGGAVLHTLREEIGDEAFWKGVNIYLNRHKFDVVTSADLKDAMEQASRRDLDWFFDQWVYHGGYPKLHVTQIYNEQTKTLSVTIEQTQKADKLVPAAFRLPLDIEIMTGAWKTTQKIELKKRRDTFTFKLNQKPTGLKLDPLEKIPVKTVKIMPVDK
jgi:aminopeptidase N